jgi:hypothetical protein
MSIVISSIADQGLALKERLVLRVLTDTDVGRYAVLRTASLEGMATTLVKNTFWFPDKAVSAGDYVVLYSKAGTPKEKPLKKGGTSHFFYWGHSEALWSSPSEAAVLLQIETWSTVIPSGGT